MTASTNQLENLSSGRAFWRSLEQLAAQQGDGFDRAMSEEFPAGAALWPEGVSRRRFLQLMSASLALAGVGLTGCGVQPPEHAVPYVKSPEHMVPGKPLYFATALLHQGYARGVLVESHEGR